MTETPDGPDPATRARTRRRALWWATVLCDWLESPEPWAHADQDEAAGGDFLQEVAAWMRGNATSAVPAVPDALLAKGIGGIVVVFHQAPWSLAARAGGPLIAVCADYPEGLIIQGETPFQDEVQGGSADYKPVHTERLPTGSGNHNTAELIEALIEWARQLNRI